MIQPKGRCASATVSVAQTRAHSYLPFLAREFETEMTVALLPVTTHSSTALERFSVTAQT